MEWTKPDFEEICLAGEVTMYVNTDDRVSEDTLRPMAVSASEETA